MLSISGKAVLVTGGSRGIGRAICLLMGRFGARVVVNYVADRAAALETVDLVKKLGAQAIALRADVGAAQEAAELVAQTVTRFGALDVLVVNHGIWKRASVDQMTVEQWTETIRINLGGAYALCHHAARHMIPRRSGCIITIASTAGQRGEAHHAHYAASKGALIAWTKSLASELAPHGIRVNGVAPGWVQTDMTRDALTGAGRAEAIRPIPLGRPGTPEEIAGPVAFLASDLSAYLFGEILSVNGGAVMV